MKLQIWFKTAIILVLIISKPGWLIADDQRISFDKVERLVGSGDMPGALYEFHLIEEELQKKYQEATSKYFPNTILDYRVIADGSSKQSHFRTQYENRVPSRLYSKDPSSEPVKISIRGEPESNTSLLRRKLCASGSSSFESEKLKIAGRPAIIEINDSEHIDGDLVPVALTVCLGTGFVDFESTEKSNSNSAKETLKKLAMAMKYDEIENYLSGFSPHRTTNEAFNLVSSAHAINYFRDGTREGLRLFRIQPNSLWATIGLKPGDVVSEINGNVIRDEIELGRAMAKVLADKVTEHKFKILRNSEVILLAYKANT